VDVIREEPGGAPAPEAEAIQSHLAPLSEAERTRGLRCWHLQKAVEKLDCFPPSIQTEFFTRIGFNEFHFGLLGLMGWLSQPMNWATAIYVERTGRRKLAGVGGAALIGVSFFAFLVPALILMPTWAAVYGLIFLCLLNTIANAVMGVTIYPWMRDLSGPTRWAGFFATRMFIGRITIPLGLIYLPVMYLGHRGTEHGLMVSFAVCFLISSLFCGVAAWAMARAPDPRVTTRNPGVRFPSVWGQVASTCMGILRSKPLRRYLLFATLQTFGLACNQTFVSLYMVKTLELTQTQMIFASTVLLAFAGMAAAQVYAWWKDRVSERAWTCVGSAIWVVSSLAWVPALHYKSLYLVLVPLFDIGNLWIMFGATNGILLRLIPGARRPMYLTALAFFSGLLPSAVPPLLGEWMTRHPSAVFSLGTLPVYPIQVTMLLGAAFYLVSGLVAWKLLIDHDPTVQVD